MLTPSWATKSKYSIPMLIMSHVSGSFNSLTSLTRFTAPIWFRTRWRLKWLPKIERRKSCHFHFSESNLHKKYNWRIPAPKLSSNNRLWKISTKTLEMSVSILVSFASFIWTLCHRLSKISLSASASQRSVPINNSFRLLHQDFRRFMRQLQIIY